MTLSDTLFFILRTVLTTVVIVLVMEMIQRA